MKAFFHRLATLLLLLLFTSAASAAQPSPVLEYSVGGLDEEPLNNVNAWLGDAPETTQARSNFLFTAQDRVDSALRALGYYSADIALQVVRSEPTWRLDITVDPGEPVRIDAVDIQVLGEAGQDEAFIAVLAEVPIQEGDQLHHGTFDAFRRRLQSLGQQRGYFQGAISASQVAVESRGKTADVRLHYDSGPRYHFGEVAYESGIVSGGLLSPLMTFSPGEPYDQAKLQTSQVQLQRTGYFSTVILRPDLDAAEALVVPISLEVYPAKSHSIDLGVGYSTDTEGRVSATWRTPQLNKWGHSQETRLQYSQVNPSGRITYSIPLTHPLNDILQLRARWEENEFGDLDSYQKELGVRREKKRRQWVYSYHLRGLNESWKVKDLRKTNNYLLPGLSLSRRDRRGSLVNPDSGFSQLYQAELAGKDAGSDVDLFRVTGDFGYIRSFGDRHRMVSRLELGMAIVSGEDREDLAPSLTFFAGGSQSIRGFSYQSIGNDVTVIDENGDEKTIVVGGERLLTGSVEYQYRVNENWRGALFLDGGDAFDEGDFNWNYAAGFGVHYLTQVGAIRVELANPISKDNPSWRLHLAIGAEF